MASISLSIIDRLNVFSGMKNLDRRFPCIRHNRILSLLDITCLNCMSQNKNKILQDLIVQMYCNSTTNLYNTNHYFNVSLSFVGYILINSDYYHCHMNGLPISLVKSTITSIQFKL
jgi:hypothetical protein